MCAPVAHHIGFFLVLPRWTKEREEDWITYSIINRKAFHEEPQKVTLGIRNRVLHGWVEGNSADRSWRKSLQKGTGTAPHISLSERALTDAAAATGLDTKNAFDRVKASMPSREKHNGP